MKKALLSILSIFFIIQVQAQLESVPQYCEGLSFKSKSVLAVSDFDISARGASRQSSAAMRDMLSNALINSGCFRVVERTKLNNVLSEQSLGLSGAVSSRSAAKTGGLTGAQVLVIGNITEFKEADKGIGLGAISRHLGGVGIGMTRAHIGLNIKLVDANSGEVLVQQSFDKKVRKIGGLGGSSLLGVAAGALFFESKAMGDAIEEAIIETVGFIAAQKGNLPQLDTEAQSTIAASQCKAIASNPKIMVVVPEIHIRRRVPDPAGETAIIKSMLEYGFEVLDPQQIVAIKSKYDTEELFKSPSKAVEIAKRYNCDIVIVGEAFSEFASRSRNGMISCRARVEARAIETSTGKILATHGTHAGGLDNSELVAGKAALRSAGDEIASYFINQLCGKTINKLVSTSGQTNTVATASQGQSQIDQYKKVLIHLKNINYEQYESFENQLINSKFVKAKKKAFKGGEAKFLVHTKTSTEMSSLVKHLALRKSNGYQIDELSKNKITASRG